MHGSLRKVRGAVLVVASVAEHAYPIWTARTDTNAVFFCTSLSEPYDVWLENINDDNDDARRCTLLNCISFVLFR